MDYLVGIDLGSTSLKAMIYDLDGNELAALLTPTQLAQQFPDLALTGTHADVPLRIMGTDLGGRN